VYGTCVSFLDEGREEAQTALQRKEAWRKPKLDCRTGARGDAESMIVQEVVLE
jgi:hypothetical protein